MANIPLRARKKNELEEELKQEKRRVIEEHNVSA